MRVLAACSLGGAGHLQPLLPLLAAADRGGHATLILGPAAMGPAVRAAGYRFWSGGEPLEEEVAAIRERLPVAGPAEGSVLANRELFGRLAARAMLAAAEGAIGAWSPDLLLRDPTEFASAAVACRRGVPTAQVAISFSNVEWGSIAVAAPAVEELCPGLAEALSAAPYLTRFPASLDFSPFPKTMRYGEPEASPRPLPDWWGGSTAPLVYVTFGTVLGYMSIAGKVFRAAALACAGLDARVLMTVGHGFDLAGLGALPGNVHVETWVDQADVLAQAALVVCHGGSGTVLGALGAGVPLLVVPVFADQFENGRRVSAAGAGVVVESVHADLTHGQPIDERTTADRIGAAVQALLANPHAIEASRDLAAEMAARPTIETVLDTLLENPTAR